MAEAMKKGKNTSIEVQGTAVAILSGKDGDYISLTDMLRARDGEYRFSTRSLIMANLPQLKARPASTATRSA
jgi:hypothetical protein